MSGGGRHIDIDEVLGRRRREAEEAAADSEHVASVNQLLQSILSDYNNRDVDAISRHLDTIKQALASDIGESMDMVYGGSVRKHTYVDGLSDVDVLVRLGDFASAEMTPQQAIARFAERLRDRLPNTDITTGRLAVTVTYSDGHIIQVLPSVATASGLRIPSASGDGWSPVIRPESFARKLAAENSKLGGRLVPTIKLLKGLLSGLPESVRPSGYHCESLAIEVFDGYKGGASYRDMLRHLTHEAATRVMKPIVDHTGQSRHVDDGLGVANSDARVRVSKFLERVCQRMDIADSKRLVSEWESLFSDE